MRQQLKSLWLTETIHLIESESGRFADQDINRQVKAIPTSLVNRIVTRATMLSKPNGLYLAQKIILRSIKISFFLLLLVSIFLGSSLTFSALSQNPINLYWALFSLLGVHLFTLILWIGSFFFFSRFGGSLLIHCWLWIAQKLYQKKTVQQLIPAFITLFGSRIRWLIGFVLNLFWTVILSSALLVLVVLLSTQHYSFEWKTTLLNSDTIIHLTHYLGYLPALFGFSIPSDNVIKLSEHALSAGDIRSSWAIWLLGVFICYGLAVRFLLMIFCGVIWIVSSRKIKLNLNDPYYQILSQQLQPLLSNVVDEDKLGQHKWQLPISQIEEGHDVYLVAVDVEENWNFPNTIPFYGFLNTRHERGAILDYLQLKPAYKMLIAIDTDRAPDRGILNFIQQLMNKSQQSRIWFINQGKQLHNWQSLSLPLADPNWLEQGE